MICAVLRDLVLGETNEESGGDPREVLVVARKLSAAREQTRMHLQGKLAVRVRVDGGDRGTPYPLPALSHKNDNVLLLPSDMQALKRHTHAMQRSRHRLIIYSSSFTNTILLSWQTCSN